jgi:hypothetical protein
MRTEAEYDKIIAELHGLSSNELGSLPDPDPIVDFAIRLEAMETRIKKMQKELDALKKAS